MRGARLLAGCGFGVIMAGLCHLFTQSVVADLMTFVFAAALVWFGGDVIDAGARWLDALADAWDDLWG